MQKLLGYKTTKALFMMLIATWTVSISENQEDVIVAVCLPHSMESLRMQYGVTGTADKTIVNRAGHLDSLPRFQPHGLLVE